MKRITLFAAALMLLVGPPAANAARVKTNKVNRDKAVPGVGKGARKGSKKKGAGSPLEKKLAASSFNKKQRNGNANSAQRLELYKTIREHVGTRWQYPRSKRFIREGLKAAMRKADNKTIAQIRDVATRGAFTFRESTGLIIGKAKGTQVVIVTSDPIHSKSLVGDVSISAMPIAMSKADAAKEAGRMLSKPTKRSPRSWRFLEELSRGNIPTQVITANGSKASIYEGRSFEGKKTLVGTVKGVGVVEWHLDGRDTGGVKGLNLVADGPGRANK